MQRKRKIMFDRGREGEAEKFNVMQRKRKGGQGREENVSCKEGGGNVCYANNSQAGIR